MIPEDPFQLLFLAGIMCLIAARGGGWRLAGVNQSLMARDLREGVQAFELVLLYLLIFGAAAGYYICFWPGERPIRRIIFFVILPTLLSAGSLFGCYAYLAGPPSSALETEPAALLEKLRWASIAFSDLPEGYVLALAGLLFIAIYISRLAFGIARLPLSLPGGDTSERQESGSWSRTLRLIWFLLALIWLVSALPFLLTWTISDLVGRQSSDLSLSTALSITSTVMAAALALAICLALAGPDLRKDLLRRLQLPSPKWCLLGMAIPAGISICLSSGQFLTDRVLWATWDRETQMPPKFGHYFAAGHLLLLLAFAEASFEEIVFRGVLQSQFIRRFGLHRGIFLVSITWGAYHFYSDLSFFHAAAWYVVVVVTSRLFLCVSLGFVLSWLTLRSRSLIPAIIAHGFFNFVVFSQPIPFIGKGEVRAAMCGVLAYVLFRYWPVHDDNLTQPQQTSVGAFECAQ